jgi:hypothetical protein
MSIIKVHLCPDHLRRSSFLHNDTKDFASNYLEDYDTTHRICIPQNGEEAAEEAFDLTNNPCREEEREDLYGCHRPVCVGDVVEVLNDDGSMQRFVCEGVGWSVL